MIAGDAKATAVAAAPDHVLELRCPRRRPRLDRGPDVPERAPGGPPPSRARSRAAGTARTSTARSHQSHVAYPVAGRCPSRYAHALPQISLIYRYPIAGGPGVTLASGGQFSAHADFFNAWRQDELQSLVDGCLNALRHCPARPSGPSAPGTRRGGTSSSTHVAAAPAGREPAAAVPEPFPAPPLGENDCRRLTVRRARPLARDSSRSG